MSNLIGIENGTNELFNLVWKAENESFDRHRKKESKALLYSNIFKGRSVLRGKNILEQLSRTRFVTGFENPALFFTST